MVHLDSLLVEDKNPSWAYFEAAVCPLAEQYHKAVLTSVDEEYQAGCLFPVGDHIVGHAKYFGALTFVSWINASTQGIDLCKGSLYYLDILTFHKLHSKKVAHDNSPSGTGYEWDVYSSLPFRLQLVRGFDANNGVSQTSITDLIDVEVSRQDLPYLSSNRTISSSSNSP